MIDPTQEPDFSEDIHVLTDEELAELPPNDKVEDEDPE